METIEPEREMVRKSAPLGVIALILAVVAGGLIGGRYVAISAAIGVVVVFANFAAHGCQLSTKRVFRRNDDDAKAARLQRLDHPSAEVEDRPSGVG